MIPTMGNHIGITCNGMAMFITVICKNLLDIYAMIWYDVNMLNRRQIMRKISKETFKGFFITWLAQVKILVNSEILIWGFHYYI